MGNPDLVAQILKSPEAQRMRWMVTNGFYDRSRIGLWMFEVIGREYDEMADWAKNIRFEAFPQTCTWSISIWEWIYGIMPDDSLSLPYRRSRILAKRLQRPPINPARIEAILSETTGFPVTVIENVAPYTFHVIVNEAEGSIYDYKEALRTLRRIKQSHHSFSYESRIAASHDTTDYSAGAVSELIREQFTEDEQPLVLDVYMSYDSGAISELVKEAYTD